MASDFQYAEGRRIKLTNAQRRQISRLYQKVADEIAQTAKRLEGRENVSAVMRRAYLDDLLKEIEGNVEALNQQLEGIIRENMLAVSTAVVENNVRNLKKAGIDLSQAYFYVPKDVIEEVVTGKIYQGRWTLSKAIWGDSKQTIKDLHTVVAKGIAENKSAYDIAKDLEKYVSPKARKTWEWSKVYPGTKKVIDYNAQRLARTMASHAYEESFVRVTKNNPFLDAYQWLPSNSDRVCPVCKERATQDKYGLGRGIYPKDKLPLDHPNGMCTFRAVRSQSYKQIADDLAAWVKGTGSREMNKKLNAFARDLLQRDNSAVKMMKKSIIS